MTKTPQILKNTYLYKLSSNTLITMPESHDRNGFEELLFGFETVLIAFEMKFNGFEIIPSVFEKVENNFETNGRDNEIVHERFELVPGSHPG